MKNTAKYEFICRPRIPTDCLKKDFACYADSDYCKRFIATDVRLPRAFERRPFVRSGQCNRIVRDSKFSWIGLIRNNES